MILRVPTQRNMTRILLNIILLSLEKNLMDLHLLKSFFGGLIFGRGGWVSIIFGGAFALGKN